MIEVAGAEDKDGDETDEVILTSSSCKGAGDEKGPLRKKKEGVAGRDGADIGRELVEIGMGDVVGLEESKRTPNFRLKFSILDCK